VAASRSAGTQSARVRTIAAERKTTEVRFIFGGTLRRRGGMRGVSWLMEEDNTAEKIGW